MESFYQESGRAGRDQLPSRSLLYYGMNDRRRMEFILSNAASKKPHPSSFDEDSSKKSQADFRQMIEYCEESGCRRKKILGTFGEQATASLCAKSCDACKHPNMVSKYLEELTSIATGHRNGSSRIFMSSASDFYDAEQFSEFWNREDDGSASEEHISDSDDAVEVAKSVARSSKLSDWRLDDRMESLQRAEENYYRKHNHDKAHKADKNSISETLRESGKQRLLNALKQYQHRLSSLQMDIEESANTLENECYKKYGKSGKSFYLSQMANTMRWLSTASPNELSNRLGTTTADAPSDATLPKPNISSPPSSHINTAVTQVKEVKPGNSTRSNSTLPGEPPILSFSEFINSQKSRDNRFHADKRKSSDGVSKGMEKKTKF